MRGKLTQEINMNDFADHTRAILFSFNPAVQQSALLPFYSEGSGRGVLLDMANATLEISYAFCFCRAPLIRDVTDPKNGFISSFPLTSISIYEDVGGDEEPRLL